MNSLTIEWDTQKNESNKRKHGVDFEEAQIVFHGENAKYMADHDHPIEEDCFVIGDELSNTNYGRMSLLS